MTLINLSLLVFCPNGNLNMVVLIYSESNLNIHMMPELCSVVKDVYR